MILDKISNSNLVIVLFWILIGQNESDSSVRSLINSFWPINIVKRCQFWTCLLWNQLCVNGYLGCVQNTLEQGGYVFKVGIFQTIFLYFSLFKTVYFIQLRENNWLNKKIRTLKIIIASFFWDRAKVIVAKTVKFFQTCSCQITLAYGYFGCMVLLTEWAHTVSLKCLWTKLFSDSIRPSKLASSCGKVDRAEVSCDWLSNWT